MSGTDNPLLPIARSFIQEQLKQVVDDDQTNWTNVYETVDEPDFEKREAALGKQATLSENTLELWESKYTQLLEGEKPDASDEVYAYLGSVLRENRRSLENDPEAFVQYKAADGEPAYVSGDHMITMISNVLFTIGEDGEPIEERAQQLGMSVAELKAATAAEQSHFGFTHRIEDSDDPVLSAYWTHSINLGRSTDAKDKNDARRSKLFIEFLVDKKPSIDDGTFNDFMSKQPDGAYRDFVEHMRHWAKTYDGGELDEDSRETFLQQMLDAENSMNAASEAAESATQQALSSDLRSRARISDDDEYDEYDEHELKRVRTEDR